MNSPEDHARSLEGSNAGGTHVRFHRHHNRWRGLGLILALFAIVAFGAVVLDGTPSTGADTYSLLAVSTDANPLATTVDNNVGPPIAAGNIVQTVAGLADPIASNIYETGGMAVPAHLAGIVDFVHASVALNDFATVSMTNTYATITDTGQYVAPGGDSFFGSINFDVVNGTDARLSILSTISSSALHPGFVDTTYGIATGDRLASVFSLVHALDRVERANPVYVIIAALATGGVAVMTIGRPLIRGATRISGELLGRIEVFDKKWSRVPAYGGVHQAT